jgi:TonB family protein
MRLLLIVVAGFLCTAGVASFEAKPTNALANPAVVSAAAPVYSMMAFQMKAHGDVIVEIKIDSKGDVVSAAVVQGHELLRAPSVQAARRWKFQPSEGSDIRVVRLTFSFSAFYKGYEA